MPDINSVIPKTGTKTKAASAPFSFLPPQPLPIIETGLYSVTGSNLGTGHGLYAGTTGSGAVSLNFKTILSDANVSLSDSATSLTVSLSSSFLNRISVIEQSSSSVALINDGILSNVAVWSSQKTLSAINTSITNNSTSLINDTSVSSTGLWSSQKINASISALPVITDMSVSSTSLWSSSKIQSMIAALPLINDLATTTGSLWSSTRIQAAFSALPVINDIATTSSSLWSSQKINILATALGTRADTNDALVAAIQTAIAPIYMPLSKSITVSTTAPVNLGLLPARTQPNGAGSVVSDAKYIVTPPSYGVLTLSGNPITVPQVLVNTDLPLIQYTASPLPTTALTSTLALTVSSGIRLAVQNIVLNVAATAVTLGSLTIASANAVFGSTNGTVVAIVQGKAAGSVITISGAAASANQLSVNGAGTAIVVGSAGLPATGTAMNFVLIETLSGASNSPNTTSTLTITVLAPPATLSVLTLPSISAVSGAAVGSVVAAISGLTSGSSLSISGTALTNNWLTVSGTNIVVGSVGLPTTSTMMTFSLIETLVGATNTPSTTSFSVTVTAPPVTLAALTLNSINAVSGAVTGIVVASILGKTTGSTITIVGAAATANQLSVNGSGTAIIVGSAGLPATGTAMSFLLVETLVGATNTPNSTTGLTITVQAPPVTLTTLAINSSNAVVGAIVGSTVANITGKTSGSTVTMTGAAFTSNYLSINGSGTAVVVGSAGVPAAGTAMVFSLVETLAGATNTPNTISGLSITAQAAPITLVTLNITGVNAVTGTAVGSVVANISGKTIGSTVTMTGTAFTSNYLTIDNTGTHVIVGSAGLPATGTAMSFGFSETLSGATNTPLTTSGQLITVQAVPATLATLTISGISAYAGAAVGATVATIVGKTSGSTITIAGAAATANQLSVNGAGTAVVVGSAGLPVSGTALAYNLVETLAGATNSPNTLSAQTMTVRADTNFSIPANSMYIPALML